MSIYSTEMTNHATQFGSSIAAGNDQIQFDWIFSPFCLAVSLSIELTVQFLSNYIPSFFVELFNGNAELSEGERWNSVDALWLHRLLYLCTLSLAAGPKPRS